MASETSPGAGAPELSAADAVAKKAMAKANMIAINNRRGRMAKTPNEDCCLSDDKPVRKGRRNESIL